MIFWRKANTLSKYGLLVSTSASRKRLDTIESKHTYMDVLFIFLKKNMDNKLINISNKIYYRNYQTQNLVFSKYIFSLSDPRFSMFENW